MRIGLFLVCAFIATSLVAKAQGSMAGSGPPMRDENGVPIFRTGIGMTEIERMIALSATGCLTQQEIGGKMFHFPPCWIVGELRGALSKASEKGSLVDFLTANDFKCQKVVNDTSCRNEFKTIQTPMLFGQRQNPDIIHTFITEVAFKQAKPGPQSIEAIKVTFTHL
jgi:hypothetical protein